MSNEHVIPKNTIIVDETAIAHNIFGKIVQKLTEEFEPIWQGNVLKTTEGIEGFKQSIADAIGFMTSLKLELPDNAIQYHQACQTAIQQLQSITPINNLNKIISPEDFRTTAQPVAICMTIKAIIPFLAEVLVESQNQTQK